MAGSAVSRFARTWAGVWERVPNLTELRDHISLCKEGRRRGRCARAGPAVLVHVGGMDGALKFTFEILTLQADGDGLSVIRSFNQLTPPHFAIQYTLFCSEKYLAK